MASKLKRVPPIQQHATRRPVEIDPKSPQPETSALSGHPAPAALLSSAAILSLQQSVGNQAVQRRLAGIQRRGGNGLGFDTRSDSGKRTSKRQERSRRRERDEKYSDANSDYPLGRELVHAGRRQRRDADKQERAEARDQAERDAQIMDAVRAEDARQLLADKSMLGTTAKDARIAEAAQEVTDVLAKLNTLIADSTRIRAAIGRLTSLKIADPGGTLAAHVATLTTVNTDAVAARTRLNTDHQTLAANVAPPIGDIHSILMFVRNEAKTADASAIKVQDADLFVQPLLVQYQQSLTLAGQYPNLKLTDAAVTFMRETPQRSAFFDNTRLSDLNNKMAGATVTDWVRTPWPGTRAQQPGLTNNPYMPVAKIKVNNVQPPTGGGLQQLDLQVGPEIIVDWLIPHPAHGLSYRDLGNRANAVLDTTNHIYKTFKPTIQQSPQHNNNWQTVCSNYAFQLILNPGMTTIITYFMTS